MTTMKQIAANQRNAQKSTGPVSEYGKSIVSRNAVKHRILSAQMYIENDEQEIYEGFREAILRDLDPQGSFEYFLVDRIISTAWRLRRIVHVETLVFEKEKNEPFSNSYGDAFVANSATNMAILSRYERSLENSLYRAIKELKALQEQIRIKIV